MVAGLALCLERIAPREPGPRFMGCTALPQGEAGLGLDAAGQPRWQSLPAVCRLSLNEDGKLQVERLEEEGVAPELHRSGRTLPLEVGQPVLVLNGDQLWLGGVKLRIHIHGATTRISSPRPISATELGAEDEPELPPTEPALIPVRPHPPMVRPPTTGPSPPPPEPPTVEVRPHPPARDPDWGDGTRARQSSSCLAVVLIALVLGGLGLGLGIALRSVLGG